MFAAAVSRPVIAAAPHRGRATAARVRAGRPAVVVSASSSSSCDKVSTASPIVAAAVAAAVALTPAAATAATVFAGRYIDPNHPHCPREIDAEGVITGIDPVPFVKGSGCRGYKKVGTRLGKKLY